METGTVKKKKSFFCEGAISPVYIGDSVAKHSAKKNIGAHEIFLGQVRADLIEGKTVRTIEFSAYREMADKLIAEIREEIITRYGLVCAHVMHSIGRVNAGEICLFVFVSAAHRKAAREGCREIVERIKKDVPVFGREIFEDETFAWKTNHE